MRPEQQSNDLGLPPSVQPSTPKPGPNVEHSERPFSLRRRFDEPVRSPADALPAAARLGPLRPISTFELNQGRLNRCRHNDLLPFIGGLQWLK